MTDTTYKVCGKCPWLLHLEAISPNYDPAAERHYCLNCDGPLKSTNHYPREKHRHPRKGDTHETKCEVTVLAV